MGGATLIVGSSRAEGNYSLVIQARYCQASSAVNEIQSAVFLIYIGDSHSGMAEAADLYSAKDVVTSPNQFNAEARDMQCLR